MRRGDHERSTTFTLGERQKWLDGLKPLRWYVPGRYQPRRTSGVFNNLLTKAWLDLTIARGVRTGTAHSSWSRRPSTFYRDRAGRNIQHVVETAREMIVFYIRRLARRRKDPITGPGLSLHADYVTPKFIGDIEKRLDRRMPWFDARTTYEQRQRRKRPREPLVEWNTIDWTFPVLRGTNYPYAPLLDRRTASRPGYRIRRRSPTETPPPLLDIESPSSSQEL